MANGSSFSIEVHLNGVDEKLLKMARETGKLDKPLKEGGVYMEQAIGKRFNSAPWAPLSPATIARHPRRAGGKPLNDTGRLRSSVTSGASQSVSGNQLRYGTSLVYAPLHNFGGRTRFGYVPAREFLFFDGNDESMIRRIFEDHIRGLM